jgi:hypothetical protein
MCLIAAIEEHSRKVLGAKFGEQDTGWENMCVLKKVAGR